VGTSGCQKFGQFNVARVILVMNLSVRMTCPPHVVLKGIDATRVILVMNLFVCMTCTPRVFFFKGIR
jgi:hypothetical protein